jgi:hypothetical protein
MTRLPGRRLADRLHGAAVGCFLVFTRLHPVYFVLGVYRYGWTFIRMRWYARDCKHLYQYLRGKDERE